MRPLTSRIAVRLSLVLTLGILGCGGSRIRGDAGVTVEPEPDPVPDPTTEVDAATTPPADPDAPAADPADPDAASGNPDPVVPPGEPDPDGSTPPPDPGPPPPPDTAPPDPVPPAGTCGGVTCPALFDLVGPCRPMGICTLNPAPLILCYTNGIKIIGESILPPNLVGLVKRADGTDCYRARVSQPAGSTARNVIWETPEGVPVASGVFDGNAASITCGNTTTPLLDPTCVAVPTIQGCTPGLCF